MLTQHRQSMLLGPPPATPDAHSAATQAFRKTQDGRSALAAAAAGAALRTHAQPPIDVAHVQTKRMQRRDSNSSNGSKATPVRPDGLQRKNSSGSMTERTFRTPSPGHPNGQEFVYVPPVPELPAQLKSHKRATSLEPPFRMTSPAPKRPGGRGVSLDRGISQQPQPPVGLTRLEQIQELERENSRRSTNYSRPLSPGTEPSQTGWFTGAVGSKKPPRQNVEMARPKPLDGISPFEASRIQSHLQRVADSPVAQKKKKKKKKQQPHEGQHFATGTVGDRLTDAGPESAAVKYAPQPLKKVSTVAAPPQFHSTIAARAGNDTLESPIKVLRPQTETSLSSSIHAPPALSTQDYREPDRPTEQANTGRKLESPPESTVIAPQSDPSTEAGNEKLTEVYHEAKESTLLAVQPATASGMPPKRTESISPARKPHFSAKPAEIENGIKHQPPARSISPAKSALKHSPSAPVRTKSPGSHSTDDFGSRAPSEASAAEEDGRKRRKSFRVSFEAPTVDETSLDASKYAPRKLERPVTIKDDDFQEGLTPRPALPSFGSVRGRKQMEEEPMRPVRGIPEKLLPSSMESSATLVDNETSKDYAVGSIFAEDFATRYEDAVQVIPEEEEKQERSGNSPIPPEVTSVEGTGYISDSDSGASERQYSAALLTTAPASETNNKLPASVVLPQSQEIQPMPEVDSLPPRIVVLPATPAAVEEKELVFLIPGAFPSSSSLFDADSLADREEVAEPPNTATAVSSNSREVDEYGVRPENIATQEPPLRTVSFANTEKDDSEVSDTSSVYSDAAEEWEDGEGPFASLNAIMESPMDPHGDRILSSSNIAPTKPVDEVPPSPTAAAWQASTAYWRSLSEHQKRELESRSARVGEEQANEPGDLNTKVPTIESPPTTPPSQVERDVAIHPQAASPTVPKLQPAPKQSAPKYTQSKQAPGSKAPALKSSMRQNAQVEQQAPKEVPTMRQSMRANKPQESDVGHHIPSTLRNQDPLTGLQKSRWAAASPETSRTGLDASMHSPKEPRGALQKKRIPATKAREPATAALLPPVQSKPAPPKPALRRIDSDESDSSFKRKKRHSSMSEDGSFNLRRTMRGSAAASTNGPSLADGQNKTKRFSLRSRSPTGSDSGMGQGHHMRMSMRSSLSGGVPTLRDTAPPKSTSSMMSGFGKSKKSPPAYRSRFTTDSDEEDGYGQSNQVFRSRFADSDDELDFDGPESPGMTFDQKPIASKKKVVRYRDSDDLQEVEGEDESFLQREKMTLPSIPNFKDIEAATNGKSAGITRKESQTGGLEASMHAPDLPASPESNKSKNRLSLSSFGIGRDKKRNSSVPPMPTFSAADRPTSSGGSPKVKSPKLLRRLTPTYLMQLPRKSEEDIPPVPTLRAAEVEEPRPELRPMTSGGVLQKQRPGLGHRRSTAGSAPSVVSDRTEKKKRFGMLRKAFRMKD